MQTRISYLPYCRKFRQPLITGRGRWAQRRGFIVQVEDSEGVGHGELAPISDFGTETIETAEAFLRELVERPDLAIPEALPCTAFALSAAKRRALFSGGSYVVSGLLSAGVAAVEQISGKVQQGYTSLKWKVGVLPTEEEIAIFERLVSLLPEGGSLRLDANGSLDSEGLELWLRAIQQYSTAVEYLEQPLAVGEEAKMRAAMDVSGVSIALDESLNGVNGRHWLTEWNGPLVVKLPLMGDCTRLKGILEPVSERVVLSSVFETTVGLFNALDLADCLPDLKLPIGFDTFGVFDDELQMFEPAPVLTVDDSAQTHMEKIWQTLLHSS
ncbi:MAG: o-succinylbenzoate synthase [Lentimonas sp.]